MKTKKTLLVTSLLLAWAAVPHANEAKAGSLIFYDNFAGTTLNPAWQVLPGQGAYGVNGQLQYSLQGPLSSPGGWYTTSLSLALPFTGTQWEADIKAQYSLDWLLSGSYTGPSVPTQVNSSGAQDPQVIMSFAPVTAADRSALAGPNYADFSRGVDAWYGSNYLWAYYNGPATPNLLNPVDGMIQNNIADGTYWLQFIRNGGSLTMNYSYDGVNYNTALTTTLLDPSDPYNELVLSGTTYLTAGSYTNYDYVSIMSIPEPGSMGLLPLGLALMGLGSVRRKRRAAFPLPE